MIQIFKDFKSYRRAIKNECFDEYPCIDYLNNALRHLLKAPKSHDVDSAISEIVYCICKANGEFYQDVFNKLCEDEKWREFFANSSRWRKS